MIVMSRNDWVELSIHTSIHCVLMITFLTLFYFLYVYPSEKTSLENTMNHLIVDEIRHVLESNTIHSMSLDQMRIMIHKMVDPKLVEMAEHALDSQQKIKKQRNKVMIYTFSLIGIVAVVLFIIYVLLFRFIRIRVHFHKIIYSVLYSIVFVAVIEICFFIMVTKKLQPVSDHELQYMILSNIIQLLDDQPTASTISPSSPSKRSKT